MSENLEFDTRWSTDEDFHNRMRTQHKILQNTQSQKPVDVVDVARGEKKRQKPWI